MKPYKVIVLQMAVTDIKETRAYYHSILPSLSLRFKNVLKSYIDKIKHNPFTFGQRLAPFRSALLKPFPYQVHYLVDEERNEVVIFAVLHAYRDPNHLSKRTV